MCSCITSQSEHFLDVLNVTADWMWSVFQSRFLFSLMFVYLRSTFSHSGVFLFVSVTDRVSSLNQWQSQVWPSQTALYACVSNNSGCQGCVEFTELLDKVPSSAEYLLFSF